MELSTPKHWTRSRAGSLAALPAEFGEYRLLRPLGQGTETQVYLAEDTLLDRFPVARVRVRVRKPDVRLPVEHTAVSVERSRP